MAALLKRDFCADCERENSRSAGARRGVEKGEARIGDDTLNDAAGLVCGALGAQRRMRSHRRLRRMARSAAQAVAYLCAAPASHPIITTYSNNIRCFSCPLLCSALENGPVDSAKAKPRPFRHFLHARALLPSSRLLSTPVAPVVARNPPSRASTRPLFPPPLCSAASTRDESERAGTGQWQWQSSQLSRSRIALIAAIKHGRIVAHGFRTTQLDGQHGLCCGLCCSHCRDLSGRLTLRSD